MGLHFDLVPQTLCLLLFLFNLRSLIFNFKFVLSELLLEIVKLSLESGILILYILEVSLVLFVDFLEESYFIFPNLDFSRVDTLNINGLLFYACWFQTLTSSIGLVPR
jgi:hypothetical protein